MTIHRPTSGIYQRAGITRGTVFEFGGRALLVIRSHGIDAAAPVIVEELTDLFALKGQLALWSADGTWRAMQETNRKRRR